MKTFFAVFFGILAAAAVLAGIVWITGQVKEEQKAEALRRKLPALQIRTITVSCETYQAMFDRYPDELSDLGSKDGNFEVSDKDPKHSGLIDPILASGKSLAYVFEYKVEKTDLHGHATAYSVTASPESGVGKRYFADQTGVIRYTTSARQATATDYPYLEDAP